MPLYESRFFRIRDAVEEKDGPVEDGDGCQVGGTGGKGFLAPTCRRHPHNSDKNEYIGHQNNHQLLTSLNMARIKHSIWLI